MEVNNDNFKKIVGLPKENYEISYEPGKIYGLAYINQLTPGWICQAGTLPFLYGCYQTFVALDDVLPKKKNSYMGIVFLELDKDLHPVKVITSINADEQFRFETEGMNGNELRHRTKIMDMSILIGKNIPELEFEI